RSALLQLQAGRLVGLDLPRFCHDLQALIPPRRRDSHAAPPEGAASRFTGRARRALRARPRKSDREQKSRLTLACDGSAVAEDIVGKYFSPLVKAAHNVAKWARHAAVTRL